MSLLAGCLTLPLLMIVTWTTAANWDHNGPDTPLAKIFSFFWEWGAPVGAPIIHLMHESKMSIVIGSVIAFGTPILFYSAVYFIAFTAFGPFVSAANRQR